jgi:hypothetical protein
VRLLAIHKPAKQMAFLFGHAPCSPQVPVMAHIATWRPVHDLAMSLPIKAISGLFQLLFSGKSLAHDLPSLLLALPCRHELPQPRQSPVEFALKPLGEPSFMPWRLAPNVQANFMKLGVLQGKEDVYLPAVPFLGYFPHGLSPGAVLFVPTPEL